MPPNNPLLDDSAEEAGWITTFADLMTLLLVFFVLLFSMSTVEADRFQMMLNSLQTTFGDGGNNNSLIEMQHRITRSDPGPEKGLITDLGLAPKYRDKSAPSAESPGDTDPAPQTAEDTSSDWQQFADQLRETLSSFEIDDVVTVDIPAEGKVVIQIRGQALFDSGSTHLNFEVDKILDSLMAIFNLRHDFTINIQGHTDNLPISTPRYESNWELSALRATTVLRYLIEKGIATSRLTATGYGDSMPIATNETEAGRAKNRRIEFVLEKEQDTNIRRVSRP